MKWFTKFLVFAALLGAGMYERCLAEEKSNLQFLESLTDSLLQDVFDHSFKNKPVRVKIRKLGAEDAVDWFFENRIVEVLKNEDVSFFFIQENDHADISLPAESFSTIEYKPLELNIKYGPKTKKFPSQELIKRTGNVQILLRIIEHPGGKILWNAIQNASRVDWVDLESLNSLENENVIFAQGERIHDRIGSSIVQPILIATVTGVIAYLFYSLRSR